MKPTCPKCRAADAVHVDVTCGQCGDTPSPGELLAHGSEVAERVVAEILVDLTDRRGLRQAWDGIDRATRGEIVAVWTGLVREILRDEPLQ